MNKCPFGLMTIIIIVFLFSLMTTYASNISITNEITSPLNRTVWTNGSEGVLREATVAIKLTNEIQSHEPVTVILAIDCSGSMVDSDPNRFRVEAAKDFVNLISQDNVKHKIGVILWKDTIFGVLEPTADLDAVKKYLVYADASGYTCISEALKTAELSFKNASTKGKVLILLSDGNNECYSGSDFVAKAREMRSNGVSIYAIGLGNSNIEDLLAIGEYYHVSKPDAMPLIFRDIATKVKVSLKNVKVEYRLAENLEPFDVTPAATYSSVEDGNILTWNIGDMYYKQKMALTFKIGSENPGNYTLPAPMNSTTTYEIVGNGSYEEGIPSTNLLVKFHQAGNEGDDDEYIQISKPLKLDDANNLFGKSIENNNNNPASSFDL
ncbi:MAG: VWA domain-containing protein [Methanotrichaceae archaeon]|nr:VWA domain-containing protein [Methanotrichaceae archaeon]